MSRRNNISASWTILTGEYPPQPGGVSDYTYQVATALAAAGDEVHVWAPPAAELADEAKAVHVHRLPDHFGKRGRSLIESHLQTHKPARLLVQYVPHAYGHRAMNWQFALWVRRIARSGIAVDVMFHEVAYPLQSGQPLKHILLALVNRQMARWLCDSASRIFCSIPSWEQLLTEIGATNAVSWLPVPSNIPQEVDPKAVASIRERVGDASLIGHFGTYGPWLTTNLRQIFVALAERDSSRKFLLLGGGGDLFAHQLEAEFAALKGRLSAPGVLDGASVANQIAACDLLVQPYGDGISCRRSSAMAGLALGVPIVSSLGHLTEPLWLASGAVALAATPASAEIIAATEAILADREKMVALGVAGRVLYQSHFDLRVSISALREGVVRN